MSLYRAHELLVAGYLSRIVIVSLEAAAALFALFRTEDNPQAAYHAAYAVASQLDYLLEHHAVPSEDVYRSLVPDANEHQLSVIRFALEACLVGVLNGRAAAVTAHVN